MKAPHMWCDTSQHLFMSKSHTPVLSDLSNSIQVVKQLVHRKKQLKSVADPDLGSGAYFTPWSGLVMSTIPKRKHKRSDIKANYRNKTKHFDLVRILSEQKQNILIWSKIIFIASRSFLFWSKNSGTKQSNLTWFAYYWNKSKTFWFGPKMFLSQANRFRLAQKFWYEAKQFDLVWKLSWAK